MSGEFFYIILKTVNGKTEEHAIHYGKLDKSKAAEIFSGGSNQVEKSAIESDKEPVEKGGDFLKSPFPENFQDVERSFSQAMLMYRKSLVQTIKFAPYFADYMSRMNAEELAVSQGNKREDLSMEDITVYSLPVHATRSLARHIESERALIEGSQYLPRISIIGIISSYDAILSDLLRVIFRRKPEIIFTSDREVKFSELLKLETLEAARDSIISNEIESVIRNSHHEHFAWMERKFSIKLREGLDVWPDFIELCERRNLLTHTGGIVSEQYLKNCNQYGRSSERRVGDKLDVDVDYLISAIDIVSEVGYKLIHTMWRKFAPDEREKADSVLNTTGMNLISAREYSLAEKLLQFGEGQKHHSSDLIKRMMVVNRANAAKLGGNKLKSDKLLSSYDWSATSYKFQICVAAVKNDFQEVQRLLGLGEQVIEITSSDFRDWPVFEDARNDLETQVVFEKVFSEPLNKMRDKTAFGGATPDDNGGDVGYEGEKVVH